jgi:DNA-binding LacI/PurR family transcriptional regulator
VKRPGRLNDIANSVGVSPSTVSRALRRPELVRAETRADIIRAATLAGYEPPAAKRADPRVRNIGLIVPDLENPFFTLLAKAAMVEARRHLCSLVVADTNEEALEESDIVAMTRKNVEYVIIASPRMPDVDIQAVNAEARVVIVNREVDGVSSVLVDNRTGMRQVVEHLVALGHRSIAYVEGPPQSWSNTQRRDTFVEATREANLESILLGPYAPRFEGGMQAADVGAARGVTAIVAYNDLVAFGIISRLTARRIPVPQAMSVVGFDDVPAATIWSPSLTTVASSIASIGKAAVREVLRPTNGRTPIAVAKRAIATNLVIRNSTAPRPWWDVTAEAR